MLKVGAIIDGRYEILAQIGEGGMGRVFKVQDLELNRVLAVKILNPELSMDAEWRNRFLREGKTLSRIEHRNILKMLRLGIDNQKPFLVTEYLIGESVRGKLSAGVPLPWRQAVAIAMQVCDGMECAHLSGIVHRDLKPENLMVVSDDPDLIVKVLDFGLARASSTVTSQSQCLTQTGALVGSAHYMSPEQCQGKAVDNRSDIYALGCTLYECLTGAPPFEADNPIGLIHQHVTAPVPKIAALDHCDSLATLNAVLQKALAKVPAERYQSMSDFRKDLHCCLEGTRPLVAREPSRTMTSWIQPLAALVLLSTFCSLCWWFSTDNGAAFIFVASRRQHDARSLYEEAIAAAEKLTKDGRPRAAIALLTRAYTDRIGSVPLILRARMRTSEAVAYLACGDKAEAKIRAEDVIVLLCPPLRRCLIEAGDTDTIKVALAAANVLRACGAHYFFDSEDFGGSWSTEMNRKQSRVESAMLLLNNVRMEGPDQPERRELDRVFLEMERPYAERSTDPLARAQYWLRLAVAQKPSSPEYDFYGKRCLDLFLGAGKLHRAAESNLVLASSGRTPKAMEYLKQADKLFRTPPAVSADDEKFRSLVATVAPLAEVEVKWGLNEEAASLCKLWIDRCDHHYDDIQVLLDSYVASLFELGRGKEAEAFLRNAMTSLNAKHESLRRLEFERRLAWLQFKQGRYALAEKTFARCIEQMEGPAYDHPYKYALFKDSGSLLDCYSILNETEKFQAKRPDLIELMKHNRGSASFILMMGAVQFRPVSEEIRKGDYDSAAKVLKASLHVQPADWSDAAFEDLFIMTSAWHLAKIGESTAARRFELRRKRASVCELMTAPVFTELLLCNYDKAERQLKDRLQRDEGMEDRCEIAKDKLLGAITALLRSDPAGAKVRFESALPQRVDGVFYPISDLLDFTRRCFYCADGKTDLALRRSFTFGLAPTLENSLAYEYLLLADIARANHHAQDAPLYLRAARRELAPILMSGHPALEQLDRRMEDAEHP